VFCLKDGPDVVLVPYALELLRDALDIRDINCAEMFFLFLRLTTTALGRDNRVNKALGITAELKVISQVVYLQQQVLPVFAYSGSSLMETMNYSSFDKWWMVRIEINVPRWRYLLGLQTKPLSISHSSFPTTPPVLQSLCYKRFSH
jgi:hypothetical protein